MTHAPQETDRFAAFVAPARRRPALWRTGIGLVLAVALWLFCVGMTLPFMPAAERMKGPVSLLLYLASFAGLAIGILLAARLLQGRGGGTLIGRGGLRLRPLGVGVAAVVLAGLPSLGLAIALAPPSLQMPPATWFLFLPLALPLIFLQSATEELVFRGYLMQSLAARTGARLVWFVLPALLFGLLHWNPADFGPNAWLGVASATASGLLLADVTRHTGNLSAAIGLHFANNVMAILLFAMPSQISTLSLFLLGVDPSDVGRVRLLMLGDLATTLLCWLGWRLLRHRRQLHSAEAGPI